MPPMPVRNDALEQALAAIDKYDPAVQPRTIELYRDILAAVDATGVRKIGDAAYGPHERHRMDIYLPETPPARALPMLLYFHQGGFIAGDKNQGGDLFFSNIGKFFARNGVIASLVNFRLPPDGMWPAGAADTGAALDWMRERATELGGDPRRIYLAGHSSGATHIADYVLKGSTPAERRADCAGLILLSGRFRLPPARADFTDINNFGRPKIEAYYGADPSTWRDREVPGHIVSDPCPVYVLVAEFDHFAFEVNALDIAIELARKSGAMPRFRQVRGHNHLSQVLQIGTPHDTLGPDLLAFINAPSTPPRWRGLVGDFR